MDLEKILKKYDAEGDLRKVKAFEMMVFGGKPATKTAEEVGVSVYTIRNWKDEHWWVEAKEKVLKGVYEDIRTKGILKADQVLEKLFDKVLSADPDKGASAQAALIKTIFSMTKDPVIDQGRGDVNVNIDQRSVNIGETVDMEKLKEATIEEKKEILLGNIPVRLRKGN